MSTILDSLKKSSKQRDENDKTSIDNFNFGNGKKSPNKAFLFIILLITLAIIYAAYVYLFTYEEDTKPPLESMTVADTQVINTTPSELKHETSTVMPIADTKQTNKKQKPNNKEVRKKLKDIQNSKLSQNLVNPENKSVDTLQQSKNEPKQSLSEVVSDISKSNKTPDKEIKPTIKKPSKPQEVAHNQTPIVNNVKKQKHPYVYELPFSIRKDIPKFTLNIHVYDKNPENRMVIINGVKYASGDLIEEEVLVKDILQEGVLLEFNSQQFLIPKL